MHSQQSNKKLYLVYTGGFLLSMHYALVAYVNSSLITQFVGNGILSTLYIVGSLLSIASLYLAPFLLKKYGSTVVSSVYVALEMVAVFGMGNLHIAFVILFLFLIHQAGESLLSFALDINLEQEITAENTTGWKRGMFLTISNFAWVLSPLLVSFLAQGETFAHVYELSAIVLIPLLTLTLFYFKKVGRTNERASSILDVIRALKTKKDSARIIGAQFILQFFFSWMIIYLPLLLNTQIGFDWKTIGLLFTIMLLPFLIFELPAGKMGDTRWGEKELLRVGFIIMFLATWSIPFIHNAQFFVWAVILFVSRIGASIVEIASESYFFKHVTEYDTGLISLFRMARPASFILAPLIALLIMPWLSYGASFGFLALSTLLGLLCVPRVDTK